MSLIKKMYGRIWGPLFFVAAFYFYPDGEGMHHMMSTELLGLPEMTWMWLFMGFAHMHLFWDIAIKTMTLVHISI